MLINRGFAVRMPGGFAANLHRFTVQSTALAGLHDAVRHESGLVSKICALDRVAEPERR